ncbi:MAG: exodeoxyribonuclease V subunit alpha [Colwellia sp.]|nr:exodeoxyribonuclease V subunit alpha [Colwellia sp.]MCW9081226.1 exodeoxyribonuclease V subunit alpha [Colwellia sp.]
MTVNTNEKSILTSFSYAQQQLADIEAIDYFFAKEMCQALLIEATNKDVLAHVFIALSANLRAGHTCLAIGEIANKNWGCAYDEQGLCSHQGFTFPDHTRLTTLLNQLELTQDNDKLLVFYQQNLYMRRYYNFESELESFIKQKLAQDSGYAINDVGQCIDTLFPLQLLNGASEDAIDWQKLAVANAINKSFSVIAGGPGTGKTYTVTKLLAALIMLASKNDDALEIALVAPTGKAAQRLTESIINAISGFSDVIEPQILAAIPTGAQTIHRLLGVIPNSPNFRHNQQNLLSCDVLLIDEVSMVDLPMMTRLFRALKPHTKVILLGDADQLPSVAVGSVLADIAPRPHHGYSQSNYDYLAHVCQIDKNALKNSFIHQTDTPNDHLSLLLKSRRFDGEGGIGKLAFNVINGDVEKSWQLLCATTDSTTFSTSQLSLVDGELSTWLAPLVEQYYRNISRCTNIEEAFKLLARFRVLCVTRQGEFGVDAINQWITTLLSPSTAYLGHESQQANYHGMPIMISENDYQLGLFNGDIGLLWRNSENQLMAVFETTEQCYKSLLPSRLPKFDRVYAMTIHKTQGSEFEHVAMILPKNSNNQLLSRELLYTGITRAKKLLTIASAKRSWQQGVAKAVKRNSGLTLISQSKNTHQ